MDRVEIPRLVALTVVRTDCTAALPVDRTDAEYTGVVDVSLFVVETLGASLWGTGSLGALLFVAEYPNTALFVVVSPDTALFVAVYPNTALFVVVSPDTAKWAVVPRDRVWAEPQGAEQTEEGQLEERQIGDVCCGRCTFHKPCRRQPLAQDDFHSLHNSSESLR